MTIKTAAPLLGKTVGALQKLLQREAKKAKPGPDGAIRIAIGAAAVATRVRRQWLVQILDATPVIERAA